MSFSASANIFLDMMTTLESSVGIRTVEWIRYPFLGFTLDFKMKYWLPC